MRPLSPAIARILYPYQRTAAQQLIRALEHGQEEWGYPGAADLSDVGIGKSFQDLASMLEAGRSPVILCPKVGIPGWMATCAAFNVTPAYIGSYEGVKGGFRNHICTRRGESEFIWHHAGAIGIILDEAQAVKGMETLASRCIDGAIAQSIPIIAASATLATSPLELRIAGRITGLHDNTVPGWHQFMVAHGCRFVEKEERWVWNGKPHIMEQLHHVLIPQRGCRVTKAMMGERPKSRVELLPIECEEGPRIQQEWIAGNKQIEQMRKQNYPFQMLINIRRKIRMRLWQESERALVPHVAWHMKKDLADGCSVLAFTAFTETREALGKLLNTRDGFYGGQNDKERARLIAAFQADRIRVLINQVKAGGSSVSLHDTRGEHPRVTYLFPSDSGQSMEQVPGRTDRAGMLTSSQVWIPCVKGTLSESMVKTTSKKLAAMAGLNDGGAYERR